MKCYLCGDGIFEVIAEKESIRFGCYGSNKSILRCVSCDLVQLLPQWTEQELNELYNKYSQKKDFSGQKRKIKISKYLMNMINSFDEVLEVGGGFGDNQTYLNRLGYHVIGIDKDPGQYRENVITGDVMNYKPHKPFDVIYGIHFLEHLSDPVKFISWVSQWSSKFIFEIPSIEDPLLALYKNKAFNRFYWYPYHMFFYSKKTIKKMFPGLNLKIIRRQEYGLLNHLRWLFLRRPGNLNFHIPILDDIYKFILTRLGFSDTLVIVGQNI